MAPGNTDADAGADSGGRGIAPDDAVDASARGGSAMEVTIGTPADGNDTDANGNPNGDGDGDSGDGDGDGDARDNDSAIASFHSSTASISPSICQHRTFHGRTYPSARWGTEFWFAAPLLTLDPASNKSSGYQTTKTSRTQWKYCTIWLRLL